MLCLTDKEPMETSEVEKNRIRQQEGWWEIRKA